MPPDFITELRTIIKSQLNEKDDVKNVTRLLEAAGVESLNGLRFVEEEDLVDLKPIKRRKLISAFKAVMYTIALPTSTEASKASASDGPLLSSVSSNIQNTSASTSASINIACDSESAEYHQYFCKPYSEEVENGVLVDFFSGVRYQSHTSPVLLKHPTNTIIIMLYHDDIELANALGIKRSNRGKMTMFYITFLNIPLYLRSQLVHIHLLAVAKASSVKTSMAKALLLNEFFNTINELGDDGLTFMTPNGLSKFHGCLLYTGDSLACHNIGGFKEGFSNVVKQPCRTCKISSQEYGTTFHHSSCILRTDTEIKRQLARLNNAANKADRENLSKEFGLNSRSVLFELNYFSLTKDLLYDPMHIFLEGVAPKETTLFLKSCITDGYFTRKELNELIANFKFHNSVSKSLYPRAFETNMQVTASSSACLNLILHLPFILKDCFETEVPDSLLCFVMMVQIVQYVLSPALHVDMLQKLEHLIASHQQSFIDCYGAENIIPKMHMMVHLPEQIRQHGPARHHWTMRMEAKNAIAKNKKFFNFKNLPFSLSEYFQLHFATNFWESSVFFSEGYVIIPRENLPPEIICNDEEMKSDQKEESTEEQIVMPLAKKSKKKCFVPVPLPQFSQVLAPLLEGLMLTETDHSRLSSIMKDELNLFLK
ncbi:hypothetical protein JTE90_028615 [Oedothorax gibbosus]|uniref:Uncharacterized protein n=1 Tax=Oedothorax gibbosus TaxID=931172 RepID=A0AAV6TXS0_9ARAC|nr:hypothetical protein JTE90_028615 [Oedothorax gibbosus]